MTPVLDLGTPHGKATRIEKTVSLRDGRDLVIRTMRPEDVDRSWAFFKSLTDQDRKYLRVDVTDRDVIMRRIAEIGTGRVERLVAVDWSQVVGDGSLQLQGHGWGDNVGEMRIIVASTMQRRGLGSLLGRELYHLAVKHRLDRIVVRMMRPQVGARRIMERLGFEEEYVIPKQARDQDGLLQDQIIMRCNLEEMWQRMKDVFDVRTWRLH